MKMKVNGRQGYTPYQPKNTILQSLVVHKSPTEEEIQVQRDDSDLSQLKRRQLQDLAKKHGIKANLKTEFLILELQKVRKKQGGEGGNIPRQ